MATRTSSVWPKCLNENKDFLIESKLSKESPLLRGHLNLVLSLGILFELNLLRGHLS